MNRLLPLLALLLLALPTHGQVRPSGSTGSVRTNPGSVVRTAATSTVMRLPLDKSGQGFDVGTSAHNLLTYSDISRATLLTPPAGVVDAPGSVAGFDNGVAIVQDGGGNYAYKLHTYPLGLDYILSVYVRKEDGSEPVIGANTATGDFCMIIDGSIATGSSTYVVEPVGGGVYRVSARRAVTTGGSRNTGIVKYSAQSATTLYVSGMQLNSLTYNGYPTSYVATGATAATSYTVSNVYFDGRHNLLKYSTDLSVNDWLSYYSTDTAVPDQGDGYVWREVSKSLATGSLYETPTIAAASVLTASTWARASSGSTKVGVLVSCQSGTVSNCACTRSDDGPCTATVYATFQCGAETDVTTTPVRVSATGTCSAAVTAPAVAVYPGERADAAGTAWFSRPQLNVGVTTPTPYVPTTTAAITSVPIDSAGLSWVTNGSPPAVASTALPTTASTGAAGPFSDANYYSQGTGSDALDSTGDRFGCVAFVPVDTSGQVLFQNGGASATAGHFVAVTTTTGTFYFRSMNPTAVSATTANGATTGGFNVACWWRTGTSISAKLNLGTTATNAAAGTEVAGTAYTAKIGRYESSGTAFTGTILSVIQGLGACPTPPSPFAATCEGWATYQMKRQFGMIGPRGEEMTFTRATTATNEVNGITWNVLAAVPRMNTSGLLVERASTNSALQSSASCVANAVNGPTWAIGSTPTCTSDVATVAPDGTTTADAWVSTTSTQYVYQISTPAASTTATASAYVYKPSGTEASIFVQCAGGSITSCSCSTSDGSACTATSTSPNCIARATGLTPGRWTRISSTATCAVAPASWAIVLAPANYNNTTGTAYFWDAQLETGHGDELHPHRRERPRQKRGRAQRQHHGDGRAERFLHRSRRYALRRASVDDYSSQDDLLHVQWLVPQYDQPARGLPRRWADGVAAGHSRHGPERHHHRGARGWLAQGRRVGLGRWRADRARGRRNPGVHHQRQPRIDLDVEQLTDRTGGGRCFG